MPEISIIVPVYNVEKYIHRCIDSILAQTFTDFELILIDDGSTDNCPAICDEYANNDHRVVVVHKSNCGQSSARNKGLEIARGNYILFCDSDDSYDSNLLSKKLEDFLRHSKQLSCFSYTDIWESNCPSEEKYRDNHIFFSSTRDRFSFLSSQLSHKAVGYSICNKIYSKEILDQYGIAMPERQAMGNKDDWCEDLIFNLQYMMCVDSISMDPAPIYQVSKHGAPQEQNETGLKDRIEHMLNLFAFLSNTKVYQKHQKDFWKIAIWHMRRYVYLKAGSDGVKELRNACFASKHWPLFRQWIHTALDNWSELRDRWSFVDYWDYHILLSYILSGNYLLFKIRSFILWRFISKLHKDTK